jgi:hypothetical protein
MMNNLQGGRSRRRSRHHIRGGSRRRSRHHIRAGGSLTKNIISKLPQNIIQQIRIVNMNVLTPSEQMKLKEIISNDSTVKSIMMGGEKIEGGLESYLLVCFLAWLGFMHLLGFENFQYAKFADEVALRFANTPEYHVPLILPPKWTNTKITLPKEIAYYNIADLPNGEGKVAIPPKHLLKPGQEIAADIDKFPDADIAYNYKTNKFDTPVDRSILHDKQYIVKAPIKRYNPITGKMETIQEGVYGPGY